MPRRAARRLDAAQTDPLRWILSLATAGAVGGIFLLSSPAAAGPPYNVDDPGTQPYRQTFLYLSSTGRLSGGSLTRTFPDLSFNYGLTPTVELDLGVAGSMTGAPFLDLANPSGAVKWRFLEEKGNRPALAASYQATLTTRDAGLGTGFVVHSGWLTGSKRLGHGLLWGNVGSNAFPRPYSQRNLFYGLAYDHPFGTRLRLGGQLYGNTQAREFGVNEELAWGAGATYATNRRTTLLLQAGRSLRGNNDFNYYAGVLLRLD